MAWLLKDNSGWDRDRIDEVIRSGQQTTVKLTPVVPVYWVYITAWANEGVVQFREDIYKRDGVGAGPAAVAAVSNAAQQPLQTFDEDLDD